MRAALASAQLEPRDVSVRRGPRHRNPAGRPDRDGRDQRRLRGRLHPAGSAGGGLGEDEHRAHGVRRGRRRPHQDRPADADAALYPHLNLTTPSSRIPWDTIPVTVPTTGLPLGRRDQARARQLLRLDRQHRLRRPRGGPAPPEAPRTDAESDAEPGEAHIFTLSAKNPPALRGRSGATSGCLSDRPDLEVADLCYTATVGRAALRPAGRRSRP